MRKVPLCRGLCHFSTALCPYFKSSLLWRRLRRSFKWMAAYLEHFSTHKGRRVEKMKNKCSAQQRILFPGGKHVTGSELSGDDDCWLITGPVLLWSDSFWLEWKWLHWETDWSEGKLAADSYMRLISSYESWRWSTLWGGKGKRRIDLLSSGIMLQWYHCVSHWGFVA